MQLTPDQVKGRIKNAAKESKADARTLMRIYMMERFLERVSISRYAEHFIIKGGMLVTAMVGVANRSTMDIDTSLKNQNLSAEDARRIVDEIKDIDIGDGVTFEIKEVSNIMDQMEYPGIRFTMNAILGKLVTPMKVDISTGDVITPRAIEYSYKLLLDDRILKDAFEATCKKRKTEYLKAEGTQIIAAIREDAQLHSLWESYQKKYAYAADIDYNNIVESTKRLFHKV